METLLQEKSILIWFILLEVVNILGVAAGLLKDILVIKFKDNVHFSAGRMLFDIIVLYSGLLFLMTI